MTPPAKSVTPELQYPVKFSVKAGYYLAPIILAASDYVAVLASLLTAWFIRADLLPRVFDTLVPFQANGIFSYVVLPAAYVLFFAYEGMYTRRLPFWRCVEIVFKICIYVSVLAIVMMYLIGTAEQISRLFVILTWAISFIYLCVSRHLVKRILAVIGLWQKPVIILGAGKTAEILANTFTKEPTMGYEIVGLIEDEFEARPLLQKYPYIGTFADAEQAIVASGVQDVIMAVPGLERKYLLDLIYRIQPCVRSLTIVPNLFGVPINNMTVETLVNEKTLLLRIHNNMMKMRNRILKRSFDFAASFFGTLLIAPILLLIAAAIYIYSPGPIFFSHMRIGKNGKLFPCYKFRSMVMNAQAVLEDYLSNNPEAREEWERDFKLKDDPRITPIGRFLRKTSLDELPQLFNVIKGEMSLVGPRPIIDKEIPRYGKYINDYYLVRPGITGYWQVSGRSDVDYDSRVQMDSWYVRNWSFWQDIVLLVKTVGVVLGRRGAY